MDQRSSDARVEAELRSLREELRDLRAEQREIARAVDQLLQTFRSLAVHLGIATEPYRKEADSTSPKDLPGFA